MITDKVFSKREKANNREYQILLQMKMEKGINYIGLDLKLELEHTNKCREFLIQISVVQKRMVLFNTLAKHTLKQFIDFLN